MKKLKSFLTLFILYTPPIKLLIILFILFPVNSLLAQAWFQQNSGVNYNLNNIFFVDANTGFVTADSSGFSKRILKTTNSGTNWISHEAPFMSAPLAIYFLDANTGFFGGGSAAFGVLYKTTNGGINWAQITKGGLLYRVYSLHFFNALTGVSVSRAYNTASYIGRTTNGGLNWTSTAGGYTNSLHSLSFANANTGYVCGDTGMVLKTTNGGFNWLQQSVNVNVSLRSIHFINTLIGWTVGTNSRVYKTTNGGDNWFMHYNQSLCGLYSVYFVNEDKGWVCGCEGAINGTTNAGSNWSMQSFATTTYLNSIKFVNLTTGWAIGTFGRILKTTTGGLTGVQSINSQIPDKYFLSQNFPNPFNPSSSIEFSIKNSGLVTLKIYDILGKEIETLINKELIASTYKITWTANNYPGGIYFYRLETENFSETKKMILLK